jgi:hypothetical protein
MTVRVSTNGGTWTSSIRAGPILIGKLQSADRTEAILRAQQAGLSLNG